MRTARDAEPDGGLSSTPTNVSQGVEAPLANVVDTNYTSVAKIAKRFLPGVDVMGGMHARMLEAARIYRS